MPDFDLGLVLGSDGADAPKIESVEKTSTSGLVDTYTITLEDGSEYTFDVTNGEDGSSVSVTQVLSSGTKLATITVDGTSTDLYCTSGGSADIVTSWESTLSDSKVPSEKLTKNSLDGKADKTNGASQITDPNAHTNIGTSAGATQATINSAIDSMIGSGASTGTFTDLQTLITNASSGDVITLDKDYKYDSTTDSSLTSGIVIDKNITINANGHIIDGNSSARAFTMTGTSSATINFTINNALIQNCDYSDSGGAIYASSYINLTINNSIFTNNKSVGGGGAILGTSHITLTTNNSTFTYNTTTGSTAYGGAINVTSYSTIMIENSLFMSNSSNNRGGALYGNITTTINNSIFTNNTSNEGGALSFRNLGSSHKLNMSGTSVYGNTASSSSNIYCNDSMTVYNCTLSDTASTYTNVTNYNDVSSENIVDNLTTNDATKVLSAKQGKAISDMIGDAITYINGTGS